MPPPWPVTISRTSTFPQILGGLPLPQAVDIADAFGAPMCPAAATAPSAGEDSVAYAAISDGIRKGIAQIHRGASFDRGSRAFARIDPAARLTGFNWTLVVFHSPGNYAFTVPDGSIFLSDALINQLSDDEVAAVIAHLIGHEAYGHDRSFWMVASPAEKAGATIGIAVLVAALIFVTKGTALTAMQAERPHEHFTIYSRQDEVEANCAAAGYLASVGVPPDTLFDAMLKLSIASSPVDSIQYYRVSESADFAHLHTAGRSAADLGKMLDTGVLSSPATKNATRGLPSPPRVSNTKKDG